MKIKNLRLEKPNRLAGCIMILVGMVTLLLQSTGHMTWLMSLPSLAMVISVIVPWLIMIIGAIIYFYK